MSTIQALFQQAQLAEAAYANFSAYIEDPKAALIAGEFSAAQAAAFVEQWTVVHQFSATCGMFGDRSGFSGTLFRNEDGQYAFSLRSTAGATDLTADAGDILTDGIALDQIVDMVNYWRSLTTHQGDVYQAVKLNTQVSETVTLNAFGPTRIGWGEA
jgi:hypothetical protein